MKETEPKFIFYFEYTGSLGGVSMLWISIFEELIKRDKKFLFFNFENSDMHKIIINKGYNNFPLIDINKFDWLKIDEIVNNEDILVITSFDQFLYNFLKASPKVIYYNLSQYVSRISAYKFGLNFKFLGRKLIENLDNKHAFAAMDSGRFRETEEFYNYQIINKYYLPVALDTSFSNNYDYKISESISFGYIGRSVDWKMMPLLKIIEDIYKTGIKAKFHLIISSYNELLKFIPIDKFQDRISFIIKESLPYDELNKYLMESSIDVGFGMGTSVLDFAKHGIPSIVVDYSSRIFPTNYKYIWLHKTSNYNLGDDITKRYIEKKDGFTIDELILQIQNKQTFLNEISNLAFKYVTCFHNIAYLVDKLLQQSNETTFHLNDAKRHVPYLSKTHNTLRRFFKLTNKSYFRKIMNQSEISDNIAKDNKETKNRSI